MHFSVCLSCLYQTRDSIDAFVVQTGILNNPQRHWSMHIRGHPILVNRELELKIFCFKDQFTEYVGVAPHPLSVMSPSIAALPVQGPISSHTRGIKPALQVRAARPDRPFVAPLFVRAVSPTVADRFSETLGCGARPRLILR